MKARATRDELELGCSDTAPKLLTGLTPSLGRSEEGAVESTSMASPSEPAGVVAALLDVDAVDATSAGL